MGFFKKLFKRKPKDKKYRLGLHKSSQSLGNLKLILEESNQIDDDLFDSIEDIFIQADIGVETVIDFIDELKTEINLKEIKEPKTGNKNLPILIVLIVLLLASILLNCFLLMGKPENNTTTKKEEISKELKDYLNTI